MHGAAEGLANTLAYDRAAVASGEGWRLATALVSHWSFAHLAANVAALAMLGFVIAQRDGAARLMRVIAVAFVAQLAALAWLSDAVQYRGSSGFAWALGSFALVRALEGRRFLQLAAVFALPATAIAAGSVAQASAVLPGGVLPDPAMHAAGALAGIGCALVQLPRDRESISSLLRFT